MAKSNSDSDLDQTPRVIALFSVLVHSSQSHEHVTAARALAQLEELGVKVRIQKRTLFRKEVNQKKT